MKSVKYKGNLYILHLLTHLLYFTQNHLINEIIFCFLIQSNSIQPPPGTNLVLEVKNIPIATKTIRLFV